MKVRKKHPVLKVILRIFIAILTAVICYVLFLFCTINTIIKGPSESAKVMLVNSFMETSALKFVPGLFLDKAQIDTMKMGKNSELHQAYINSLEDVEINIPNTDELNNELSSELDPDGDGIIIEDIYGRTYCAKMMIILDPSRVDFEVIDSFSETGNGMLLSEVANHEGVVAVCNGGGFLDNLGTGNGGMPLGVTIKDGVLRQNYDRNYPTTIGFDKDHKLIIGNMSGKEALDAGIINCASFGPVLVKNGVISSSDASGLNPRTAIGQREDGAILLLAVDGRQPHSIGATYQDLAEIMASYGAVNAANLDGGSSSMLFYNGEMINSLGSAVGERRVPTAIVVR